MNTAAAEPLVPKQERFNVLLKLVKREGRVDVLNAAAVDDYIDATHADCKVMPYGANKCPQMGVDLSAMATQGLLRRGRVGLPGMAGMGFPRWVWSYQLTAIGERVLTDAEESV